MAARPSVRRPHPDEADRIRRSRHDRTVDITEVDMATAFCFSSMALGHGWDRSISDIIFVCPDTFNPSQTVAIAKEIGLLNGRRGILR